MLIATMDGKEAKIRFEPVPLKSGLGWRVLARRPGGQIHYISGFETESDALDWINHEGLSWFSKLNAAEIGI